MSRCLKEGQPDGDTRRAWLEALLAAELTDIELGGIDLAPSARDAVLEHASDEDWAWIEKEVRAQIHKSRDWEREALVNFLSEWRGHQRQDKEAAALIRELGTPEQRHPQEAIALYRELVEQAIGRRQRSAYQEAVRYLKRVKALYKSLGAQSDWDAYLQSLRTQYAHLPALQDELRKARL